MGMYKDNEHKKTKSMGHTLGFKEGLTLTAFSILILVGALVLPTD
jgi:hypothetical protein